MSPMDGRGATTEELRAYIQERLALLSKLAFWIFLILVVFVHGLYEIYPQLRPRRVAIVDAYAISGLVVLGLMWHFLLRRRRVPKAAGDFQSIAAIALKVLSSPAVARRTRRVSALLLEPPTGRLSYRALKLAHPVGTITRGVGPAG